MNVGDRAERGGTHQDVRLRTTPARTAASGGVNVLRREPHPWPLPLLPATAEVTYVRELHAAHALLVLAIYVASSQEEMELWCFIVSTIMCTRGRVGPVWQGQTH